MSAIPTKVHILESFPIPHLPSDDPSAVFEGFEEDTAAEKCIFSTDNVSVVLTLCELVEPVDVSV